MSDLLSQEEIDALLNGVDDGHVETASDVPPDPSAILDYDFTQQDRIVRGRLPTLEMVNDRFARFFRTSLFGVLRKTCEVSVLGVRMLKFSEYVQGLAVPSNLNLIKLKPLRGTGLVVMEPRLVFTVIDNFFGGDGRYHARIEGRDFTPTENRVIQILLAEVFTAMVEAWAPVMAVQFEFLNSEINPQFANIVSPTETVVVSRFHIELDGGGGEIHLTLPYSMVEPIRTMLDAGVQSDRVERDDRWINNLHEEVMDAELEISALLLETHINIGEFLSLRVGDVIPLSLPELTTVFAEDIPIFRGRYGQSGGRYAVRFNSQVRRRELRPTLDFSEEKAP
ncbi:flagellar motor switch protein FliM [Rhodanobacter sp. ANJX3]|jgi:flagellar motor switch protein FliM|uniref:flagellar motor switch protein FliM n=1 Tax=unclassified Rhodanobacter TaxID=2621553 RepID=UPI0015CDE3B4|nr:MULTISPECIES: flagellar motor switch protein FliM [unclassified Rhodanobacter]MBB5359952.1 flagellar motor switch protein FliM [Rhodanobacter sp. ANJX3]NYE28872.1 flagellar motor switch protein FliM [Rhodanobacter sp. K2T2]